MPQICCSSPPYQTGSASAAVLTERAASLRNPTENQGTIQSRSLIAMLQENVFVGHMIFRKQVQGEPCGQNQDGNAADAARCAAFPPSTTFPPSGS